MENYIRGCKNSYNLISQLVPYLMAASVLACVIFIFFLPCFSNSCTPTLPCHPSIQIKPPFNFQSDITIGLNCPGYLTIGCDNNITPFLSWFSELLPLESISYDNNTITVQDPYLSNSLKKSGCRNLYFNFSSPINLYPGMYDLLNSSISSVRCDPPDHIQSLPKIFGMDYNLSYSLSFREDDKHTLNCSKPENFHDPFFEYMFSFKNDSSELTLLSASYSGDLVARPGCFAKWKEVLNHEHGNSTKVLDHEDGKHFPKGIIIGSVVGSTFVIVICGFLLVFYKRKKLRLISSSSKLLVQREDSDQYFRDPEMVGSEYTQIFSYEELREATQGFSESKELGDGGFGIVYKGILKDGRTVAVKRLYKNSYKSTEQFMNEVKILSGLHHPNLVTLYGSTARSSRELLLVFEFIANGTVADHLHGPRSSENALTWPVRLSIAIETANALAYLHAVEPPIIHRDVKTNNILLDDGFHVKVGDFGLSRLFPLDVTHVSTVPQGTPGYVDPVYHQCYHLTDKSDVYSFGVVLVELISSKPAVDMSRSIDEINLANLALKKIQRSELDELVDPNLGFQSNWEMRRMVSLVAELAFQCLQCDRDMRPSIKEVLEALKVIEKGGQGGGDKLEKKNSKKEEAHLLQSDAIFSPVTVMDRWKSSSTTSNTSV